jgi:hypothetical protein
MGTQGVFGYIIGKKKRFMNVQNDANLLWQISVREIFILIKHYGSKEILKSEFEKIKSIKEDNPIKPKTTDIEKCKLFTDLEISTKNTNDWNCLLRYCQTSYINLLEAGYILNTNAKEKNGYELLIDFNKYSVTFSINNFDNSKKILNTATIEEIMDFDEMPTKSYTEIITEMKTRNNEWFKSYDFIKEQLKKLNLLKQDAKKQADINIEKKLDALIDDVECNLRELIRNRREFYYRLKAIDLIEE